MALDNPLVSVGFILGSGTQIAAAGRRNRDDPAVDAHEGRPQHAGNQQVRVNKPTVGVLGLLTGLVAKIFLDSIRHGRRLNQCMGGDFHAGLDVRVARLGPCCPSFCAADRS